MTQPHIHGRWRSFSVSNALEVIGETLTTIRREDGLTWKEVGRILGKSDDRASDYATAVSEMPVGAFLLGLREWNGRFGNPVLAMIGQSVGAVHSDECTDTDKLTRLLRLAHLISAAIGDDKTPGVIDDLELDSFTSEDLDAASRAIGALRARKERKAQTLRGVA